jgi:hypothetical protein
VQTAKVKVTSSADEPTTLPVVIPGLEEVRTFAGLLHKATVAWQGELWGWPAEYTPESQRKPLDSNMTFTPAEFWIGVSNIWFFSMMWEDGSGGPPVEFLDDRGIVVEAGAR